MSFVNGFYSFNLDITNPEAGTYQSVRVKTPMHPNESSEHLHARLLAYCHCYQQGQEFTQGLFEPKEPTIWNRDVLEELLLWVQIGCPDSKKLKNALRQDRDTDFRVYFYKENQIGTFCSFLKGSKSNWIDSIKFYKFDYDFLKDLSELLQSSSDWNLTILDDSIYLTYNKLEFETLVSPIDMWQCFQVYLEEMKEQKMHA